MNRLIPFLSFLIALCLGSGAAFAQTTSLEIVRKVTATDAISEDLDFLTGRTLNIGSGATLNYTAGASITGSLSEFRDDLGLEIGADVQAWDADLDAIANGTYLGNVSITTLGTITTGTWSATTIAVNKGGTGQTTAQAAINAFMAASGALSQGDLFYYNGTNVVRLAAGTSGYRLQTNGTSANPSWTGEAVLPRSYLAGLTLTNNLSDATNDIDIAIGSARDTTDAQNLPLTTATTKRLDAAWSAGTGNGGLDQGSIANATYHVHAIRDVTNGLTDAIFSLSHDESAVVTMTIASPCVVTWGTTNRGHGLVAGSPFKFSTTASLPTGVTAGTQYYVIATGLTETTFQFSATNGGSAINSSGSQSGVHTGLAGPQLPSGYTVYRRIGSIVRASAAILPFWQDGDDFTLVTSRYDVDVTNLGAARTTYALTVPVGIRVKPKLTWWMAHSVVGTMVNVVGLDETDAAPSSSAAPSAMAFAQVTSNAVHGSRTDIFTNASAQIGARSSAATTSLKITTRGWADRRGRDR